jgi:hypothetical protein
MTENGLMIFKMVRWTSVLMVVLGVLVRPALQGQM